MKQKSCCTNLLEFFEVVTSIKDEGGAADIFYLDFSKAFDKVPHARLAKKLESKGVDGNVLAWLVDWLSGRTQQVRVGGQMSDVSSVDSGVPQGTILGPPLFDVFIDDIDECAKLIDLIVKFADDTKGVKRINSIEDRNKLQTTLDLLCRWAKDWGMSFNKEKCKIMHIGNTNPRYEYFMEGTKLTVTSSEKDVGVVICENLKPAKQVQKAAGTAAAVLRQISRNFHFRDRHIFMRLYKQYVRPHMEFSTPVWNPWLKTDIDLLENVQKRAVRMVAGLQSNEYEQRCEELGLEPLEKRREATDLIQTFKILHGYDKLAPEKLFRLRNSQVRTRQASEPLVLEKGRCKSDLRSNWFSQRVVKPWNELPATTKTASSVTAFKRLLKLQEPERIEERHRDGLV